MIFVFARMNPNPGDEAMESIYFKHCSNLRKLKVNAFFNEITSPLRTLLSQVFKFNL